MRKDRGETTERFRDRLNQVLTESGRTRSAFAERVGLDRSTLSQLLSGGSERLPRAETIVAIAREAQVSVDWLLGLSEVGKPGTELVSNALEIEPDASMPMDERLVRWHSEAAGSKIRYVPATLPDLMKSPEVIQFEYQDYGALVPKARMEQSEHRLAYTRRPEADIEVCSSLQSLETFAFGNGKWKDVPRSVRIDQLEHMIELSDELYPTFRWFLFDGAKRFSAPYTIFGVQRASIYIGNMYFVFNATEQIRALTRHFDDLIRAALVQPPEVGAYILDLMKRMPAETETVKSGQRPG